MIWLLPVLSFSIPLALAIFSIRKSAAWVVLALLFVAGGVMLWAIPAGQRASGWDGIGYAIITVLGAAPALLGTLIGAGIGWFMNRREAKKLAVAPDRD